MFSNPEKNYINICISRNFDIINCPYFTAFIKNPYVKNIFIPEISYNEKKILLKYKNRKNILDHDALSKHKNILYLEKTEKILFDVECLIKNLLEKPESQKFMALKTAPQNPQFLKFDDIENYTEDVFYTGIFFLKSLKSKGDELESTLIAKYCNNQSVANIFFSKEKTPALFLDRDGIIVEDTGYPYLSHSFKFLEIGRELIKIANEASFPVIILTNQSGIARRYYSLKDFLQGHNFILNKLKSEKFIINETFICPFHKESKNEIFNKNSFLRKPQPGMILNSFLKYRIDINQSLMIGDQSSDKIKLPGLKSKIFNENSNQEFQSILIEEVKDFYESCKKWRNR